MQVSIAIFARGDEASFLTAMNALDRAASGLDLDVTMFDLGRRLGLSDCAAGLAALDPRFKIASTAIPDLAQAFNDYVHRRAPARPVHIFLDTAVEPLDGAFASLAQTLSASPRAHGVTALAANGRSWRDWAKKTIMNHGLNGQLFALTDACLQEFRQRMIFMPVGLTGVDGLIAYLLLTDLQAGADDSHIDRLLVAEEAFFSIRSLRFNDADLMRWRRRLGRLARRKFENEALYPPLKSGGLAAMPVSVGDLFRRADLLAAARPRLHPLNWWIDRMELDALRRFVR